MAHAEPGESADSVRQPDTAPQIAFLSGLASTVLIMVQHFLECQAQDSRLGPASSAPAPSRQNDQGHQSWYQRNQSCSEMYRREFLVKITGSPTCYSAFHRSEVSLLCNSAHWPQIAWLMQSRCFVRKFDT